MRKRYDKNEDLRKRILQNEIPKIIEWMGQTNRINKAYLFGSILEEGNFGKESDIDLGIIGADNGLYFDTWRQLEELSNLKIDLRVLDRINSFTESVTQRGKLIYEKR
ncbi:nucleotidyltransferase domain-containing protein [bacterium]|nr:nucleotidyltransferase domain-containing protein [bacterium]